MTEDRTTWEQWGQDQTWLTRSGETKHLHGPAMFARSNVPPKYIDGPWPEWPDPLIQPAMPATDLTLYDVYAETLTHIETYDPQPDIVDNSGISIFQVNPQAAEHEWERDHTRLIASRTPWPTTPCDNTIIAPLAWLPRDGVEVRYFIRAWTEQFFRHDGPAYTEPDIPPLACPFTIPQWAALIATGTPCHGMVQTYQLSNYFDGQIHGCTDCDASIDPPWDGELHVAASRCSWGWDSGTPTLSFDGKDLYRALVYRIPAAWQLQVRCIIQADPQWPIVWEGNKFTGQTPAGTYVRTQSLCAGQQPDTLTIEEST